MKNKELEEEKKTDRRRVKYLLLLLLLTAVMLSTSTYAWFTTNRIVSVNSLNVKVQTEGSLEIYPDGTNWGTQTNYEEIINVHSGTYPTSVNQLPAYIKPVSTGGNIDNNGYMEMFLGTVSSNDNGDYALVASRSIEEEGNGETSNGNFTVFDLFIRVTKDNDLYLTDESQLIYNGDTTGTENAMRVAFVVEGNVPAGSNLGTIQSLKTTESNNVYIWEPNYNTHTPSGITNAHDVYGITTSSVDNKSLNYDGIIRNIEEEILINRANANNYPNYFKNVNPNIKTVKGYSGYQNLFRLSAGITKIRVYMWLEGQDVDCENNASIGNLGLTLQFSTNPA